MNVTFSRRFVQRSNLLLLPVLVLRRMWLIGNHYLALGMKHT
jgi:hypothetical protein